jgi:hypothetical protein
MGGHAKTAAQLEEMQAAAPVPPVGLLASMNGSSHATHEGFALGLLLDPPHLRPKPTVLLSPVSSSGDLEADYSVAGTTDCVTSYPARNQGSCGSCYSFAATTMYSINYCIDARAKGKTGPTTVFGVQSMVSCNSKTGGCRGGSTFGTFWWLRTNGITSRACYPYASGGGSGEGHFERGGNKVPACRTSCVDSYMAANPGAAMKWHNTKGHPSQYFLTYKDELSIANGMKKYGALWCAFAVYQNFKAGAAGSVIMNGAGKIRGYHAVACYGWGTTSAGVPYWKCLNSWGGWGHYGRGSSGCTAAPPAPARAPAERICSPLVVLAASLV